MTQTKKDLLQKYYRQELEYLRKTGKKYAKQYPKIARRLELSADGSSDPHIERLIESFAFLTARIQCNLDSEFQHISTALLGTLYPQFMSPVPSMATAQFQLDPDQAEPGSVYEIPKATPLVKKTNYGDIKFRTCYPVELWPVEVIQADFLPPDHFQFKLSNVLTVLRLRIQGKRTSLSDLPIERLRFYLNGEIYPLYELLFGNVAHIAVTTIKNDTPVLRLSKDAIHPVGFGSNEDVLPYHPNTHTGYRLLQEYFTFPEKFMFFDLEFGESPINTLLHPGVEWIDVLIMLDQLPADSLHIDKDTFSLGCTPIINLFEQYTEPIRVDETRVEYILEPGKKRESINEIHSILSVSGTSAFDTDTIHIEPFFSFNHHMEGKEQSVFWNSRRESIHEEDFYGTRMLLSFVDLDFNPSVPPARTVFAKVLCTNRLLAHDKISAGEEIQLEKPAPVSDILILEKPTPQIDPPLQGATLWRLISHLSLNYLSLNGSDESLRALKEILLLYDLSQKSDIAKQVAGIKDMSCNKTVTRIGVEAWRGFCRGIEITLTFDEQEYAGSSAFLFASVLNRFFPLYAAINSFTKLIIKSEQRRGDWKEWPPMVGEQIIL